MSLQKTIPECLNDGAIEDHYFCMGRCNTLPDREYKNDVTTLEIMNRLYKTYPYGVVVAREIGDVVGKEHFHYVVMAPRAQYVSAQNFVNSVRKTVTKYFGFHGNEEHSCKECFEPVGAVGYAAKQGEYEYKGWNSFFFHIVGNITMMSLLRYEIIKEISRRQEGKLMRIIKKN